MKKLPIITFILLIASVNLFSQELVFLTDTITTKSGLKFLIISEGTGKKVQVGKEIAFHWTGYFLDGKSFGTSRGLEPYYYNPGKRQVIAGAEEGLLMMKEGDRYLFIIPPYLAYGSSGSGSVIPPNATLIFDYEVVSVTEPKLSITDTLLKVFSIKGIDEAIDLYKVLKANQYEKFAFRESELNNLGYALLENKRVLEAIEVFKLNVEEYPDSWNVYDSLAEGYMLKGEKENAIKFYKKSIEMNPGNKAGKKNLERLENNLN